MQTPNAVAVDEKGNAGFFSSALSLPRGVNRTLCFNAIVALIAGKDIEDTLYGLTLTEKTYALAVLREHDQLQS